MEAILSPMGVSSGATVKIGSIEKQVKACTKLVFTYHGQTSRTTLRVGDRQINSAKKLDELLKYAGYDKMKDMYRDLGTGIEFVMSEGKLILYLLEFTELRFSFV